MINLYIVIPGERNKYNKCLTQNGISQASYMGRFLTGFLNKSKTLIITNKSAACNQTTIFMYSELKAKCNIVPYVRKIPEEQDSLNAFIMWVLKASEFTNIVFVTDEASKIDLVNKYYNFKDEPEAKMIHFTYNQYSRTFSNNGIINNQ